MVRQIRMLCGRPGRGDKGDLSWHKVMMTMLMTIIEDSKAQACWRGTFFVFKSATTDLPFAGHSTHQLSV